MTENMKKFIKINNKHNVYQGEHLTAKLKPFKKVGDVTTCVRYNLEDGSTFIITKEDQLSAPDYTPKWGFEDE